MAPVRKLKLAMLMPAPSRMRASERPILGVIDDFILIFIHDEGTSVANLIFLVSLILSCDSP